jgi:CBS domain-containing protein
MKVSDVMTRDVEIASPDDDLQTAAQMMRDIDTGALPVGENDRLVGMVTDRDITVRAVAEGKAPRDCKVRDVMTADIRYCFEDEDTKAVADKMAQLQVRRLPVLDRNKRLVGIVSLGDLATGAKDKAEPGQALHGISQPAGTQAELAFAATKPGEKK